MRVLTISGSLRARSSNAELLQAVGLVAPAAVTVDRYDGLAGLPHFNPDLDLEGSVLPPAVAELRAAIAAADALLISSPEYAHGVPGSLKNALDWLVSGAEMPGKPVGVLSTSARATHAPASLVETLRTMSAVVVPGAVRVVPLAGRPLDAMSIAADPSLVAVLLEAIHALAATVEAQDAA